MASTRGARMVAGATLVAFAMTGCATASRDISATYVSPNTYQAYDCAQIAAEGGRLQTRIMQLGGRLDQAASNDKAIVGVGVLLFWPVLFAVGGTKTQEAEFARLKGEYDALQQAAIEKKCAVPSGEPGMATAVAGSETGAPPAPATPAAVAAAMPGAAVPGGDVRPDAPFAVGDRLTYQRFDPVSGGMIAEQSMTIRAIDRSGVEFGDGELKLDRTGTAVRGSFGPLRTLRMFAATPTPGGRWPARIESNADPADHADVTVTAEGPVQVAVDGLRVTGQRVAFQGFTSLPRRSTTAIAGAMPLSIRGSAVIEPVTGVVLSLEVQTDHPLLGGGWKLVRRRSAGA